MPNNFPAEFDKDVTRPIQDLTSASSRLTEDSAYTYYINLISDKLGIPWEPLKTIPFSNSVPYLGFNWNLSSKTVTITAAKKEKYKMAIEEWLSRSVHTLDKVQKLYGKLLHSSLIIPAGRAYLTNLEAMLGSFTSNPFMPHHPPQGTAKDLCWWINTLSHTTVTRNILGPCIVTDRSAFSDASSGVRIGIIVLGILSLDEK